MAIAQLDRWLIRMAIVGALAALVGAGVFWLVLTQPVTLAMTLDRAF